MIQVIFLVIVVFVAFGMTANPQLFNSFTRWFTGFNGGASTSTLTIKDQKLTVDVADTAAKRSKGLGGRASLSDTEGMLFVFDKSERHRFWMKGMQIPLDFIWIEEGKVVEVTKNIPAPVAGTADAELPIYQPAVPVRQMLEVSAGFADRYQIQPGDLVQLNQ